MNGKSTVKSLIALTMAGAMVFSMNTMPVSAAKKKTKAKSTVKSVKVVAPSGSKKSATVAKGKSIKLAVTVNATKKAYKKVTYKVSNKKVISVSKKGVVKGKKAGTATVKVISAKNKKKTASIKIKVVSGAVKKVKLNKSNLALNVGDSGKLSVKVTASKKAYKTLKWTTSNKKVATVTSKGVVKGIGKGTAKKSAPGAAIIQIIGGIGEVSFPYALSKPITILGPICGQIAALFWLTFMDGGAVGAISPGSIIALIIMSPKGKLFVNVMGYVIAAAVSFVIVAFFLKRDKTPDDEVEEVGGIDLSQFVESHNAPGEESVAKADTTTVEKKDVKKIAFACDAGMGSSAMGASMLKTQLNKAGVFVNVDHVSIHQIPEDVDVVITNTNLLEAAKKEAPAGTTIIEIKEFLNADEHKAIAQRIKQMME